MAELLSPGVFIEEVPSQVQVVGSVSTSTMAIVGFTKRGPTDKATLVTTFEQFTKTFGAIAKESFVGLSMAAFFANGGRRAYVVRVVPADAVAATCKIMSQETEQSIEAGDGSTTVFTKTGTTTTLKVNSGASPILASSVSIKYRGAGTPVTAQALKQRDGTTALVLVPSQTSYEGRINPASLPAIDLSLDAVVRGTCTIKFTLTGPGAQTVLIPVGTGPVSTVTQGSAPNQIVATLDSRTGRISLLLSGTMIPAGGDTGAISADFTPAGPTKVVTDNGSGAFAGDGSGTITYATGAYSLTASVAPHNLSPILATYKINAWSLNPVAKGLWGNDLQVQIVGNADSYTAATNRFSKFNVSVLLKDATTGLYQLAEAYEELDLDNPSSDVYFPDVINELSDLISVVEPSSEESPQQLAGLLKTMVIAAGSDLAAGKTISSATASTNVVLVGPIAPRSLVITYTASDGTSKTIKDDGKGNLTGDVDSSYVTTVTVGGASVAPNTVNYTSGAFNFQTTTTIKGGTVVTATYATTAAEAKHIENFGDTSKLYTAGSDGTFNTANFSRSQFTSPSLASSYKGVFALDRIDDILQVIVPDFAGDVTVTGDLLDYAAGRAAQPCGGDRFIILTVPKGSSATDAVDWFRYTLGRFSSYAALYWPWVKVADPNANNRSLVMPALGHIAGVYARTDSTKNVGKSPGGTVDGALNFLLGLEMVPTQGERDVVYPNKINPLVSSPQTGLAVWGVRTISNVSDWRYINARRLFMFLEKSVYNATFWTVFENNGPGLWARIKTQLNGFLLNLFNDGYFAGGSPSEAFFVTVDDTNNTTSSIDAGQVICDVGAAPNKPAEFVRFRFQQKTLA